MSLNEQFVFHPFATKRGKEMQSIGLDARQSLLHGQDKRKHNACSRYSFLCNTYDSTSHSSEYMSSPLILSDFMTKILSTFIETSGTSMSVMIFVGC